MFVLDSHVHLKHGDAAGTEYAPETIAATMDEAGIDQSVVFAMSTTTRRSVQMADAAAHAFPGRLIPYVYALPSFERQVLGEIDAAISERGFRGIKIHSGECKLAPYIIDPVLDLAAKRDVPCLVDFRGDCAAPERMAAAFPKATIIIAHLGKYLCEDGDLIGRFIRIAEAHDNVVLDASGVVLPQKIEQAVQRVGSARVVFGTDGPHEEPDTVAFARNELDKILALNLSEEEKADVLGNSIARLLKT